MKRDNDIGEADPLSSILCCMLDSGASGKEQDLLLTSERQTRLARMLHYRISKLKSPIESEKAASILEGLSGIVADRLLSSPRVSEVLRTGGQDDILLDLLNVAEAESDGKSIVAWSLLGNKWLGLSGEDQKLVGNNSLFCGVPIDSSCGLSVVSPSGGMIDPYFLGEDQIASALNDINSGVEFLRQTYHPGYRRFVTLVSNMLLRGDRQRPNECWGATSGIAIGRLLMVNPFIVQEPSLLGELLLHETVHISIDCGELKSPLWNEELSLLPDIVSPWSGNVISSHAMLHAVIVWAILLDYWNVCVRETKITEKGLQRRTFVASGAQKFLKSMEEMSASIAITEISKKVFEIAAKHLYAGVNGTHSG